MFQRRQNSAIASRSNVSLDGIGLADMVRQRLGERKGLAVMAE
jgi:hypothetical protein